MIHYLRTIAAINSFPAPTSLEWLFHPGMLFGSRAKWWGDFGLRHADHEGLDVWMYRTRGGRLQCLNLQTRIPIAAAGRVINICPDFLGVSVIVEQEAAAEQKNRCVIVYSHLDKQVRVEPLQQVRAGEEFATLASTRGKKSGIPPHLHISVMEISREIPFQQLDWSVMGDPDINVVKPFNPFMLSLNPLQPSEDQVPSLPADVPAALI